MFIRQDWVWALVVWTSSQTVETRSVTDDVATNKRLIVTQSPCHYGEDYQGIIPGIYPFTLTTWLFHTQHARPPYPQGSHDIQPLITHHYGYFSFTVIPYPVKPGQSSKNAADFCCLWNCVLWRHTTLALSDISNVCLAKGRGLFLTKLTTQCLNSRYNMSGLQTKTVTR